MWGFGGYQSGKAVSTFDLQGEMCTVGDASACNRVGDCPYFQMDLPARFRRVAQSVRIPIADMVEGRHYSIQYAERVGNTVQFTITHDETDTFFLIYLPIRYVRFVTDLGIADINSERIWRYITFRGYCITRRQPILEIS